MYVVAVVVVVVVVDVDVALVVALAFFVAVAVVVAAAADDGDVVADVNLLVSPSICAETWGMAWLYYLFEGVCANLYTVIVQKLSCSCMMQSQ